MFERAVQTPCEVTHAHFCARRHQHARAVDRSTNPDPEGDQRLPDLARSHQRHDRFVLPVDRVQEPALPRFKGQPAPGAWPIGRAQVSRHPRGERRAAGHRVIVRSTMAAGKSKRIRKNNNVIRKNTKVKRVRTEVISFRVEPDVAEVIRKGIAKTKASPGDFYTAGVMALARGVDAFEAGIIHGRQVALMDLAHLLHKHSEEHKRFGRQMDRLFEFVNKGTHPYE